jgi:hypothetical protein
MTSEMGEMFNALKKGRQEKRAANRQASPELLAEAGVPFEVKNDGVHLIVAGRFDFWPGTGLFRSRKVEPGKKRHTEGYGVQNLIRMVKT